MLDHPFIPLSQCGITPNNTVKPLQKIMNTSSSHQTGYYTSIAHNKSIASGYAVMFEKQNFQFHITANFNRTTTLVHGRDKLRLWSSRVDRELFGSRYYKKSVDERLFFVAVPEYGNSSTNLHYHMLARLPINRNDDFSRVAELIWKELNPVGSLFVQVIGDTEADRKRVIEYDLKEAWQQNCHSNIILSSEFSGQAESENGN
jgi:hypothetical protein